LRILFLGLPFGKFRNNLNPNWQKMQKVIETAFQQKFLDKLKDALPSSISLVHELAEKLDVSIDSAYRRIRNETSMSLDEALILAQAYRLSLDSLMDEQNSVTFHYKKLNSIDSFYNYFENFYKSLCLIKENGGNLIYAADDIPIFHNFLFRELAAFKAFYFLKSVFNIQEFQGRKFSFSAIPDSLLDLCQACHKKYLEVESIEIWNEKTIDGTIRQIEFFYESGLYENKADLIKVTEQLLETIKAVEEFTANKSKGFGENFSLYEVELMIGNNCVLVNTGKTKISYVRHQTVNTMVTTHQAFNEETEMFLNNLISKSTLLSGVGEKHRHQFFLKVYAKINKVLENLKQ
jgi:plasmid maintenance system antidote protein VapI